MVPMWLVFNLICAQVHCPKDWLASKAIRITISLASRWLVTIEPVSRGSVAGAQASSLWWMAVRETRTSKGTAGLGLSTGESAMVEMRLPFRKCWHSPRWMACVVKKDSSARKTKWSFTLVEKVCSDTCVEVPLPSRRIQNHADSQDETGMANGNFVV